MRLGRIGRVELRIVAGEIPRLVVTGVVIAEAVGPPIDVGDAAADDGAGAGRAGGVGAQAIAERVVGVVLSIGGPIRRAAHEASGAVVDVDVVADGGDVAGAVIDEGVTAPDAVAFRPGARRGLLAGAGDSGGEQERGG